MAGEAFLGGRLDTPPPAALIKAMGLDVPGGEGGEEGVIGVYMVREAVYEEQEGGWWGFWLRE